MTPILCVGHAVQDFVFTIDVMPTAAEKYRALAFESVGGGPAATAAVAIAKLGGTAHLAARAGDDSVADAIVAELEGYGVDCELVRRCRGTTSSVSAVLLDAQGERTIVNYVDPDLDPDVGWLPDALPAGIRAVLADSSWPEGSLHALQMARSGGVPGVLDADLPAPPDAELVAAASHVAFSAAGLAAYAGNADPVDALADVAAITHAWCAVTLGGQGTLINDAGKVIDIPAFEVPVVDTLGAGDVWHGAFALALAEGKPASTAARFANAAAALKVSRVGSRTGAPARQAVDEFLARQDTETTT